MDFWQPIKHFSTAYKDEGSTMEANMVQKTISLISGASFSTAGSASSNRQTYPSNYRPLMNSQGNDPLPSMESPTFN